MLAMPFIPPTLCSRLERLERLTERRYIQPKLDGRRVQVHTASGAVACCSVDWEYAEIAAPSFL